MNIYAWSSHLSSAYAIPTRKPSKTSECICICYNSIVTPASPSPAPSSFSLSFSRHIPKHSYARTYITIENAKRFD